MPSATTEAPSVALSCECRRSPESRSIIVLTVGMPVANNFWGKEDAGVGPLLDRMVGAKQTSDELRSFYNSMPAAYRPGIATCDAATMLTLHVQRGRLSRMSMRASCCHCVASHWDPTRWAP
jgi:hypothetical protein